MVEELGFRILGLGVWGPGLVLLVFGYRVVGVGLNVALGLV